MKITMIATAGTLAPARPRARRQFRATGLFSPQLGTRVPTADAVPPSAPDERCP